MCSLQVLEWRIAEIAAWPLNSVSSDQPQDPTTLESVVESVVESGFWREAYMKKTHAGFYYEYSVFSEFSCLSSKTNSPNSKLMTS